MSRMAGVAGGERPGLNISECRDPVIWGEVQTALSIPAVCVKCAISEASFPLSNRCYSKRNQSFVVTSKSADKQPNQMD